MICTPRTMWKTIFSQYFILNYGYLFYHLFPILRNFSYSKARYRHHTPILTIFCDRRHLHLQFCTWSKSKSNVKVICSNIFFCIRPKIQEKERLLWKTHTWFMRKSNNAFLNRKKWKKDLMIYMCRKKEKNFKIFQVCDVYLWLKSWWNTRGIHFITCLTLFSPQFSKQNNFMVLNNLENLSVYVHVTKTHRQIFNSSCFDALLC